MRIFDIENKLTATHYECHIRYMKRGRKRDFEYERSKIKFLH